MSPVSPALVLGLLPLAAASLALAALAVRSLWRRRSDPGGGLPPDRPRWWSPADRRTGPALRGQLLFAASVGRGTVGLDCLLHRTSQHDLAGLPVHLVAALTDSPALAAREREQLRAWLEGSEAVDVELSLAAAHPQVTLACNATVLTLDVPVG